MLSSNFFNTKKRTIVKIPLFYTLFHSSLFKSSKHLWTTVNFSNGVIDVLYILEERQKAGMEQSQKASKAMENYEEVQKKFNKIKKHLNYSVPIGHLPL